MTAFFILRIPLAGHLLICSSSVVTDFLVIGGGIAGAGAGYFLAGSGHVTLLEAEPVPGLHSTGRSAALFSEYYGNSVVRALTAASRPFFTTPPPGFAAHPLLAPRGTVTLCPPGADALFAAELAVASCAPVPAVEIDSAEVRRRCPIVRPGAFTRAMFKPATMDIDVAALHEGFLRGVRCGGGQVITRARVRSLAREGPLWRLVTDAGEFAAPVVVNAAGAWADEVAALGGVRPAGLMPRRRTAFLVDPPGGLDAAGWPLIADVAGTFYLKPESGRVLISPADETLVPPGDTRPDDLDIAIAAERVAQVTTLAVRHVRHSWAGLRSAVPDDTPVVGEAPDAPGFIWLAGLGGYGIQTAPALCLICPPAGVLCRIAARSALRHDAAAGGEEAAEPGADVGELAPARLR
jgi:D-arginine dehydrogenase